MSLYQLGESFILLHYNTNHSGNNCIYYCRWRCPRKYIAVMCIPPLTYGPDSVLLGRPALPSAPSLFIYTAGWILQACLLQRHVCIFIGSLTISSNPLQLLWPRWDKGQARGNAAPLMVLITAPNTETTYWKSTLAWVSCPPLYSVTIYLKHFHLLLIHGDWSVNGTLECVRLTPHTQQ